MINISEDPKRDPKSTVTIGELSDLLQAIKLLQDDSGSGSVRIVFEGGAIKDIETVIKQVSPCRPAQEQSDLSGPAFPSLESMRQSWQRYETIRNQKFSAAN